MLQYVDFLRKVPLFSELSEDELRQLAGVVREQHYRRNVTIFHINDPGNALFIIKSGMVKVTIEDQTGREIILRILYPMEFFGEMALIESLPRSATVTTQEPTEALVMYRDHFLLLIEKTPRILLNMTATLSRRLRKLTRRLGPVRDLDVLLLLTNDLRASRCYSDSALSRARTSALRLVSWVEMVSIVSGQRAPVAAVSAWNDAVLAPNRPGSPPTSFSEMSRWYR